MHIRSYAGGSVPEIDNFYDNLSIFIETNEYIFWLDVSMSNSILMQMSQTLSNSYKNFLYFLPIHMKQTIPEILLKSLCPL